MFAHRFCFLHLCFWFACNGCWSEVVNLMWFLSLSHLRVALVLGTGDTLIARDGDSPSFSSGGGWSHC